MDIDIEHVYDEPYIEPEECKELSVEEIIAMYNVDRSVIEP